MYFQHSISASHMTEKMQVGMCSVMVGATKIKPGATSGPRGRIWPWLDDDEDDDDEEYDDTKIEKFDSRVANRRQVGTS